AISNVRERLAVYGLTAKELKVGNAESLPYPDGSFDLVYSWGVIHHSPDTEKCLSEISRVARKGAPVKVMVY
ncbi:class I SAM-dependent methyltransferase, partial [Acinetobacter baumannii]|uniref:class I SAM-dependent methyltransferase n=1 Tax=Acinetobacter baumannii TaxID=470 RepID=UPI00111289A9